MNERQRVLLGLVDAIVALPTKEIVRVAIDGVDGAGKTVLADELASLIESVGRTTIRASVDGFHNPRSVRYRRGRTSPEGFYYDSYDYHALSTVLLDPLSPGGSRHYRVATFDHRRDAAVQDPERVASAGDILLFDGIFLHRPELRHYWDYSVFLDVQFAVSIPRGAQRGEGEADLTAPYNHRYIEGQRLYLQAVNPMSQATVVVNNDDLTRPYVVGTRTTLDRS